MNPESSVLPQFLSEVEAWCKVCSEGGLPSEMQELELAIHRHQSLYEQVTQAYTEVRHREKKNKNPPDGFWEISSSSAAVWSFICRRAAALAQLLLICELISRRTRRRTREGLHSIVSCKGKIEGGGLQLPGERVQSCSLIGCLKSCREFVSSRLSRPSDCLFRSRAAIFKNPNFIHRPSDEV